MNFWIGLLAGWWFGSKVKGGAGQPGLPGGLPWPFPWPGGGGDKKPGEKPPEKLPGGLPGGLPWPKIPPGWGIPGTDTPPGGGENKPPPPDGGEVPPVPPKVQTYVIKTGDYPSGLAKKRTGDGGRWRELLKVNPEMSTYTDSKGQTQIRPWNVNQTIVLPPGW